MIPLKWNGRDCFIVARTSRGWPVIHFDDEGVEIAVEPQVLQEVNMEHDIKALTRTAPRAAVLPGD